MVAARLAEATEVMRYVVPARGSNYCSTWRVIGTAICSTDVEALRAAYLPTLSSAALDRAEEVVTWLGWVELMQARIVWLRADGQRWKLICHGVGLGRAAAYEHWACALCIITCRLNGVELPARLGKRRLIARMRLRKAVARASAQRSICRHL